MKSLIIDKKEEQLQFKGNRICTSKHSIPITLIDILIATQDVYISASNIIKISNANIPILFLSRDSKKFALTLPALSKNSELKVLQYKALNFNIDIAKNFLYQKFISHQESLRSFDVEIDIQDEVATLAIAKSIDEILGIEGSFARKYFKHYFAMFERKLTKGYRSKNRH